MFEAFQNKTFSKKWKKNLQKQILYIFPLDIIMSGLLPEATQSVLLQN